MLVYSLEAFIILTVNEQNFHKARTLLRTALAPAQKIGKSALGNVVTLWGFIVFKEGGDSLEEIIREITAEVGRYA